MAKCGRFGDQDTEDAFGWLTETDSLQAEMLESAMRNYADPVYDPSDVAKHLLRALSAPMAGFKGNTAKVNMMTLAVAIIDYAINNTWDVVIEKMGDDEDD